MALIGSSIDWQGTSFATPARGRWPIHVLQLADIGVDHTAFLRGVRPSFDRMSWDMYDVTNRRAEMEKRGTPLSPSQKAELDAIVPHRRRAMRKYGLTPRERGRWRIEPNDERSFTQAVNDYRARTREFALIEPEISMHEGILTLLASAAETVRAYREGVRRIDTVLHQVTVVARPAQAASPAPEGVHQDGADYIVSALVVDRTGVTGGVSCVREGRDGPAVLEVELSAGSGIFQADAGSPLWHEISPISLASGADAGHRMTFGIDIHVS